MPENASSVNVEKLFSTCLVYTSANNTMAHECVHWHIHRNYFNNLRRKAADSDIAFRCPTRISDGDDATRDEERMEKQARGIAPRILMPKKSTQIKLQELFASRSIPKDGKHRIAAVYKRQVT